MSLAIEMILAPATRLPDQSAGQAAGPKLNVFVVFTSLESTIPALREAGALATNLGARVTLVVPQVVAFSVPLDTPPVLVEFNEERFCKVATECSAETNVQIYLCRDRLETLKSVLKPGSLVVLGGRKRWWSSKEERLARQLRRAGCEVVFKETE